MVHGRATEIALIMKHITSLNHTLFCVPTISPKCFKTENHLFALGHKTESAKQR